MEPFAFLNRDGSSLLQRVLEADAAEDAFDDDDYEVDTPKRRHRGKGRVSGASAGVISRLVQRTEVRLLNSQGSCGRSRGCVFCRYSQCLDVFPQGRGSGRRRADADDDKPYICDSKSRFKLVFIHSRLLSAKAGPVLGAPATFLVVFSWNVVVNALQPFVREGIVKGAISQVGSIL